MSGEVFDDYSKEKPGIKSHTGLDWMDKGPENPKSSLKCLPE